MELLVIDPYFAGSHKQWLSGYVDHSGLNVTALTLPGKFWKWRMHGAAITFARLLSDSNKRFDLILVSDMLDLATFKGLAAKSIGDAPVVLYMHENQLMYPFSEDDTDKVLNRDNHYGFINITSCLAADKVFFNSSYHLNGFLESAKSLMLQFPDYNEADCIERIEAKSEVLPVGLDLRSLKCHGRSSNDEKSTPVILWNHRWEHDKNPDEFFEALLELNDEGLQFNLVVVGESFGKVPKVFEKAKIVLADKIKHWGYCESRMEYTEWLHRSDILPVTSNHDFFGISVVEAIYCGVTPLLPDRLAYPGHIFEKDRSKVFYGKGEFKGALRDLILNWDVSDRQLDLSLIKKYDWENLAPIYDRTFTDLAQDYS